MCAAHHLAQHVADSTRGNNTLDLVISDFEGPVATAIHPLSPPPPIVRSDHAVVTACLLHQRCPAHQSASTRNVWRYSSAEPGRLRHFFGTTDWSPVTNDNPNHSSLNIMQRIIQGKVISDFEGPVATAIHPQPPPPIGRSDHAVASACFTSAAPHINQPTTRKV